MKKIFIYFAALAALLTVSCNTVELDDVKGEGLLRITLNPGELETRAENQTAKEKAITHFDYFFFKNSDGTELITRNRVTGTTVTFNTATAEYKALAQKSYLYVIANYPEEIPSTVTTKDALLTLPVKVAITSLPDTPFVMDSYDKENDNVLIELKPTADNEVRTQVVNMRRIAAKFVVNVTIPASVTNSDQTIWKPTTTTKDFYMYMVNSFVDATSNGTTIAGTPFDIATVSEPTKFYTYNHKHSDMIKGDDDLHWTSADYYSYPVTFKTDNQKAPYFKIQMPWVNVKSADSPAEGENIGPMGTHMFYYKVVLPEITAITRNTLYTLNVTLNKVGGTEEDYVIVSDTNLMVTNWLSPSGEYTGYYSARFLDCARDIYYAYGDNSIEVPVTSSHPITVKVTSATKITYNITTGEEVVTPVTSYTATANGKSSFNITHLLDNRVSIKNGNQDVTNPNYDYTPITYEVELRHEDGKQPHVEKVTVVQYPPVYVYRDLSNGKAYVNSYSHNDVSGGRHYYNNAYNNNSEELGQMNKVGTSTSQNNNANQYVVTVSVLPEGYTIAGMTPIIGDPRGGELSESNLGYQSINNYTTEDVKSKYNAVSSSAQNVIAPQIRIASSWGATTYIRDYDRAEERCAAYQENGYPAGRWRVPTVAEIDFLIKLSTFQYIPALFTPRRERTSGYSSSRPYYYVSYWANGPAMYAGKPFTDQNNPAPYVNGRGTTTNYYEDSEGNNSLLINGSNYFRMHVRCVYDQWYWGEEQYNKSGQKITENTSDKTPAEQWIGYIF